MPRMKSRVPSIGSMIHLRPFEDSRAAPSSPNSPSAGNARCSSATINFSHSRSAMVTGDSSDLASTPIFPSRIFKARLPAFAGDFRACCQFVLVSHSLLTDYTGS